MTSFQRALFSSKQQLKHTVTAQSDGAHSNSGSRQLAGGAYMWTGGILCSAHRARAGNPGAHPSFPPSSRRHLRQGSTCALARPSRGSRPGVPSQGFPVAARGAGEEKRESTWMPESGGVGPAPAEHRARCSRY